MEKVVDRVKLDEVLDKVFIFFYFKLKLSDYIDGSLFWKYVLEFVDVCCYLSV